jgi:hypothetical protein
MARTVLCFLAIMQSERLNVSGDAAPKGKRVMDDNSGWIIIGLIILLFIFTKPLERADG